MDVDPAFGGVEALEVRVRNWAGNVDIKEPKRIHQRPLRRGPDEWAWALEQAPGKLGRLRLVLSGEQPGASAPSPDAGGGAVMPEVTVTGAALVEQWAAVAGSDLTAEAALGLAPVEGPPAELAAAASAAKMGKPTLVWKATAPQWRLNLAPRDAAASAAPIEVYLAEYRAAPADVGRWLHEAVYWLRHDANTDLNLTLPADAEVLSVAIDDEAAAPLQAAPRRLWLPLTGRPAVCRVRVRWRYTREDRARPNLDRPTLEGAPDGVGLWTVLAPPGWGPEGKEDKTDLHSGLAASASLSWQRAEALLRISAALAQQAAEGGGAAAAGGGAAAFLRGVPAGAGGAGGGAGRGRARLAAGPEAERRLAGPAGEEQEAGEPAAFRGGARGRRVGGRHGRRRAGGRGAAVGRGGSAAVRLVGRRRPRSEGGAGAGGRPRAAGVDGVGGVAGAAAADRLRIAVAVGRGLVARLVAGADRNDRLGRLVGDGGVDADRGGPCSAGGRRPVGDGPRRGRPSLPPAAGQVEIDRPHAGAAGIVRVVGGPSGTDSWFRRRHDAFRSASGYLMREW